MSFAPILPPFLPELLTNLASPLILLHLNLNNRFPDDAAVVVSVKKKLMSNLLQCCCNFKGSLNKNENSLIVPSTGLYFVYSQLLFHKDNCKKPLLLTHNITSWSSDFGLEVELLKSIKSVCEEVSSNKKLWFESIYQGAVFQLNKGDRLMSKTNFPEYLDFTHSTQIYFGVIAM
uniref:Tumor necrosis factor n=1 Tax=Naja naja TaxID=35670 RepID=A0A8C6VLQ6_NAJNA